MVLRAWEAISDQAVFLACHSAVAIAKMKSSQRPEAGNLASSAFALQQYQIFGQFLPQPLSSGGPGLVWTCLRQRSVQCSQGSGHSTLPERSSDFCPSQVLSSRARGGEKSLVASGS